MRVVTIVSLGASAVLGLAALVVAKTVLPNAAASKAQAAVAPPVTGVAVVAAKGPLKFGERLDAGKLVILHIPSNAVPEGAFTTVAQALAQDAGGPPVVLTAIAAREAILPSKLSGPGARPSVAAEIADGMRAYTIKVSDVTGVGGHALPGDRVDVVLMRDLTPEATTRAYVSEVVLQNARVLGVDLNADLASDKPATPSTVTLEVPVEDAQKLAVAGDLGKLSLALRRTGSAEIAATAPMRAGAFVQGGGGARPLHVQTVRRVQPAAAPRPSLILIEEGEGGGSRPKKAPRAAKATVNAAAPAAQTAAAGDQPSAFKPSIG